jgi:transposase
VQAVVTQALAKRESAREVRWWIVSERAGLEEDQRNALDQFLAEHAEAPLVYELAQEFGQLVRERRGADLAGWLERAREGPRELRGFAGGIERDRATVYAAMTEAWSQGQTEGQIHRLKLIRREMYGRGRMDLLRRRVLEATHRPLPPMRESQHFTAGFYRGFPSARERPRDEALRCRVARALLPPRSV